MSGPFIFIATNRLKPGKLDEEKARVPGLVEFIEANEPRLIAFNEYANEDGTEVAVVQIHPDAASMAVHMEIIAGRAASAYAETVDATTGIQVFGTPSDAVVEMLRRQAGAGVPLSVKPYTTEVHGVQAAGDGTYVARVHLEGTFPGGTVDLTHHFTVDGDRISRLEIAP